MKTPIFYGRKPVLHPLSHKTAQFLWPALLDDAGNLGTLYKKNSLPSDSEFLISVGKR